ncbi:MAG TPA: hypothetical protein VGR25_04100 [bacterium]|jgi:hypothetical protein|nr:hypothetical protein [bacterium]
MDTHPAFSRENESFVPPEQVMTRLMRRRASRARALWLEYLFLGIVMAGVLAGLFLAARG